VHSDEPCRLRPAAEHSEFGTELHRELWRHFVQRAGMLVICFDVQKLRSCSNKCACLMDRGLLPVVVTCKLADWAIYFIYHYHSDELMHSSKIASVYHRGSRIILPYPQWRAEYCNKCSCSDLLEVSTGLRADGNVYEYLVLCARVVAWHSGRTSVSGRRIFHILRSTYSW